MDMSQTEWKRTGEKYSQLNADAGFYMIRNGAAKTCKNIHCNGEMSRKNKVLISRI